MTKEIQTWVETASSKALGTYGPAGVNVVPVSIVRVVDDRIWLFNFFMGKTLENIKENQQVSLACWRGLEGIQLKAHVRYITEGTLFEDAVAWVATQNPARVVLGLLELTLVDGFDVSAFKEKAGATVALTE